MKKLIQIIRGREKYLISINKLSNKPNTIFRKNVWKSTENMQKYQQQINQLWKENNTSKRIIATEKLREGKTKIIIHENFEKK